MEITNEIAMQIATNAGDIHMREAGREVWSAEDARTATAVYKQLAGIVQKMDTGEDEE